MSAGGRTYCVDVRQGIAGSGFIREIGFRANAVDMGEYPFCLPVVQQLADVGGLDFPPGVTFLVGENGSGKSTLVEAMAVAAGMNPEGGSQNYRFTTRSTESALGEHLTLKWGIRKPRSRFFLRAESYYNVATESEALGSEQIAVMGGVSPHERSHGESFVDLMRHRFYPHGLYLLDEPEAALSVPGCLALVARIADLVTQGSQFVVATHSPILMAVPGARILQIGAGGAIEQVDYDEAEPVVLTRGFLADPDRFLHHLFSDES